MHVHVHVHVHACACACACACMYTCCMPVPCRVPYRVPCLVPMPCAVPLPRPGEAHRGPSRQLSEVARQQAGAQRGRGGLLGGGGRGGHGPSRCAGRTVRIDRGAPINDRRGRRIRKAGCRRYRQYYCASFYRRSGHARAICRSCRACRARRSCRLYRAHRAHRARRTRRQSEGRPPTGDRRAAQEGAVANGARSQADERSG